MEATETVQSPTETSESASTLMGLLYSDTAPQQSIVEEVAPTETVKEEVAPVVTETVETKPAQSDTISIEDEPVKETTAPVADDDFESKYRERLSRDLGADLETIKVKLSAPQADKQYKTELAKLADELEVGTKMTKADFFTFVATDFKEMAPKDVLDFQLKLDDPNLTAEEREHYLIDKYKLYEDATPAEKAVGKVAMNKDFKEALAKFDAHKEKLVADAIAPAQTEAPKLDAELEAKKTYWKTEAPNLIKSFDKLPVSLKIADPFDSKASAIDVPINFDIPARDKAIMQEFVEKNGALMGFESKEQMLSYMQKQFVAEHYPKLVQKATERAISIVNEKWALKMAAYEAPKGKTPAPTGQVQKGSASEFLGLLGVKN